jgi:hypothetical protein
MYGYSENRTEYFGMFLTAIIAKEACNCDVSVPRVNQFGVSGRLRFADHFQQGWNGVGAHLADSILHAPEI